MHQTSAIRYDTHPYYYFIILLRVFCYNYKSIKKRVFGPTMQSTDIQRYTRPLHVLYAEDSATMRHATERMLRHYFDHVDTAVDGQEAFEFYKTFYTNHDRYYDIVITDLEMPHLDGQALSTLILDLTPHQQIIVISSLNDSVRLINLMNLGVKKFLAKPVEPHALHDILYDVSKQIFIRYIQKVEQSEIEQHNLILKKREKNYLKKLQKSLKELEEFNDALNESGIVSKTDPEGNITYVNDKFCDVSGYTRVELIGQTHHIINSGEMSSAFFSKLWHTITAARSYKGIFKNRAKNGSIYYVESLIKPITDIEGEITEYISIAHDITLMMESIEAARKAEKSKDEFFMNIGHEMRTPLNAILGLTPLLKRRAKEDLKLLSMLEVIEQSGENLHHLIESVLDLQKIQLDSFELNETEFEPALMLEPFLEHCRHKAQAKEQIFKFLLDPALPKVLIGDAKRFLQAVNAVIENAIKFTPKGGKIGVRMTYDTDKYLLVCAVRDTGIGIAREDLSKMFKITQIDSSVSRKHEGAGLGLTLANEITRRMNGTVTVESAPGKGSLFVLSFGLKRPE